MQLVNHPGISGHNIDKRSVRAGPAAKVVEYLSKLLIRLASLHSFAGYCCHFGTAKDETIFIERIV